MKTSLDFDSMSFMQFIWYYDRLQKQKKKEASQTNGQTDLVNALERFKGMNTG